MPASITPPFNTRNILVFITMSPLLPIESKLLDVDKPTKNSVFLLRADGANLMSPARTGTQRFSGTGLTNYCIDVHT